METKQLEVACPCCHSRLLIDVRTGKLLRTLRAEELDATGKPVVGERDWSEAVGRVRERERSSTSRLDDALAAERGKADKLDDLFRKAKQKLGQDDDEAPPGGPRP